LKHIKRSLLVLALLAPLTVAIPQQAFSADGASAAKVAEKAAPKVVATTPASQPVVAPTGASTVVVPKAPEPTQLEAKWWQLLLKHLLELVFVILGILATGFVTVLMKKYGFESQTAQVNDILERARGYAEQLSIKKFKLDGKPVEPAQKMELAIQFAQKLAEEYKLGDKGKVWWEGKIESWMGMEKKKKNGTTPPV